MKTEKTHGIMSSIDLKKPSNKLIYAIIVFILVVTCAASVIPIIWVLLSGFKSPSEIYKIPPSFFPDKIDLGKIALAWNQMKFYKTYVNTFIAAGGATACHLLISGIAGYVLSKLKPCGYKVMFMLIFWSMLIPSTTSTVPIYMSLVKVPIIGINLSNSYIPLWLMFINAFDIILFKSFFDGISDSIVESARIDGAGIMRIFFWIILPLSMPVFMTVAMFTFNAAMGQYFWPYLLITDNNMTMLGVQLYKMKNSTFSIDYQMLAIIFSIIPQVVVFTIFQKNIIGGVSAGAVKG